MKFEFQKAVRRAVPMLISISSVSGGGKTYSALLLAAGIAGPNGRVGMLDTENGRGSMYADSPGIQKAMPNGFSIVQMDAPFSPGRYTEAIRSAEAAGLDVLVIDSVTHEWEGLGGCAEIAETKKLKGMPNWALAKKEHKLFMLNCLSSKMHLIFCIRARDKVKIIKVNGQEQVVPMGLQPVTEKNFVFEMLVSLQLEEQTHFATAIKVPEPLAHLFPGGRLITVEDGRLIREWNSSGAAFNMSEQIIKRARAAAEDGIGPYEAFFKSLTTSERKALAAEHEANKEIAMSADAAAALAAEQEREEQQ